MDNLVNSKCWQALNTHQGEISKLSMRALFSDDNQRFSKFSAQVGDLLVDYSRQRITKTTLQLLIDLANQAELNDHINALFAGQPVNHTEKRPALHPLLRKPYDGSPNSLAVKLSLDKMAALVSAIHHKQWLGATGKPIKHIVNIGIGGSHTGPLMVCQALKNINVAGLDINFISTVDPEPIKNLIQTIDLEATLIIVSSKSFSTIETLTNAKVLMAAFNLPLQDVIAHHVIAITANTPKAIEFGIAEKNIIPIWEWVGGRYSVWSAIGLPIMLQIGKAGFEEFLAGAHHIDQHFQTASFEKNLPVITALLNIWNSNFFGAQSKAIIPYADRLKLLVSYLQQAIMESNGKCVTNEGFLTQVTTAPIIFGEEGCNGQHTYHQMLHQSLTLIPVDMILLGMDPNENLPQQRLLLASALSQAQALMQGKTTEEAEQELIMQGKSQQDAKYLAPHKMIPGNKPCSLIYLPELNPYNLGSLLAMYEHQIFVESVIWNINPFDQWGVELGKQLLPAINHQLETDTIDHSSSMAGILTYINQKAVTNAS